MSTLPVRLSPSKPHTLRISVHARFWASKITCDGAAGPSGFYIPPAVYVITVKMRFTHHPGFQWHFAKSPHWKDVESLWSCQSKSTGGATQCFVCVECDTPIKRKGPLIHPWGTQHTRYALSDSEIQPYQESGPSLNGPLSSQSYPIKVVVSCCEQISSIHFFLIIILRSSGLPNRGRRQISCCSASLRTWDALLLLLAGSFINRLRMALDGLGLSLFTWLPYLTWTISVYVNKSMYYSIPEFNSEHIGV